MAPLKDLTANHFKDLSSYNRGGNHGYIEALQALRESGMECVTTMVKAMAPLKRSSRLR